MAKFRHKIFEYTLSNGPLAIYVKLRVAHAPGMPGTFSPAPRVSDSDMHHDTCVTSLVYSFKVDGGESIPGACATHNFTYLVRDPYPANFTLDHVHSWVCSYLCTYTYWPIYGHIIDYTKKSMFTLFISLLNIDPMNGVIFTSCTYGIISNYQYKHFSKHIKMEF